MQQPQPDRGAAVDTVQPLPRTPGGRWKLPRRYALQSIIGTGAYGTVCDAYDRYRDRYVAIKKVRDLFRNEVEAKRTLRELAILKECRHDHIVRIHDVIIPPEEQFSEVYIVMEEVDSDMKKLIYTDVTITQPMVQHLMYNLLVGVHYIHSAGIYHRDLKPANVLINRDCTVKICDFNLSRAINDATVVDEDGQDQQAQSVLSNLRAPFEPSTLRHNRILTGHVVTRYYRAPELLLCQSTYDKSIDNWSVGCIHGELVQALENGVALEDRGPVFPGSWSALTPPPALDRRGRPGREMLNVIFSNLGIPDENYVGTLDREDARQYVRNLRHHIVNTDFRAKFAYLSEPAFDMLQRLLRVKPSERLSIEEALQHEFVEEVRCHDAETSAVTPIHLSFEDETNFDNTRLRELFREHAGFFGQPAVDQ